MLFRDRGLSVSRLPGGVAFRHRLGGWASGNPYGVWNILPPYTRTPAVPDGDGGCFGGETIPILIHLPKRAESRHPNKAVGRTPNILGSWETRAASEVLPYTKSALVT